MRLVEKLKQWQHSNMRVLRGVHYVAKGARRVTQFLTVPEIRSKHFAQLRFREQYFQRSTSTSPNRYPILFEQCRKYLADTPQPKILSFGCSTGEEVFSLGEYLPRAIILGVDINGWCIRQCEKRKQSNLHSFCARYSRQFDRANGFDAIFCMAVFQRSENRTSAKNEISADFKFEHFEREIGVLNAKLKPGGLLIIDHADFSFEDTAFSNQYKILKFEQNSVRYNRPLFDRSNRRISDSQCLPRVFVKQ